MRDLAEGGYIERAEPVLLIGDCGTGKTHLLTGLCVAACRQKRRVRFTTAAALVNELVEAKHQLQLRRVMARWSRYDLIAIDEVTAAAYMPKGQRRRAMLARLVANWRKGGKTSRPNAPERISPKHAAILVTRAADQMTEAQQHLFDRISAQCPDVIELRQMALAFRTALTGGDAAKFRLWVEGARHCEYGSVVRFAYGLRKDLLAVSAAVESPWSTGQVEGQINRLKMIKRQMYGRAGFHLLRARVLPYTPAISAGPAP
jgi:hypothetical protein